MGMQFKNRLVFGQVNQFQKKNYNCKTWILFFLKKRLIWNHHWLKNMMLLNHQHWLLLMVCFWIIIIIYYYCLMKKQKFKKLISMTQATTSRNTTAKWKPNRWESFSTNSPRRWKTLKLAATMMKRRRKKRKKCRKHRLKRNCGAWRVATISRSIVLIDRARVSLGCWIRKAMVLMGIRR